MTLESYDADKLDGMALRILDIAAIVRKMSAISRDNPELRFATHDKKALEWLASVEHWAHDSVARLEMALIKQRGAKRAQQMAE